MNEFLSTIVCCAKESQLPPTAIFIDRGYQQTLFHLLVEDVHVDIYAFPPDRSSTLNNQANLRSIVYFISTPIDKLIIQSIKEHYTNHLECLDNVEITLVTSIAQDFYEDAQKESLKTPFQKIKESLSSVMNISHIFFLPLNCRPLLLPSEGQLQLFTLTSLSSCDISPEYQQKESDDIDPFDSSARQNYESNNQVVRILAHELTSALVFTYGSYNNSQLVLSLQSTISCF